MNLYGKETINTVSMKFKKNEKLRLLFKKCAKLVVPTVPFIISLLYLLYFMKITLEYSSSLLINEF